MTTCVHGTGNNVSRLRGLLQHLKEDVIQEQYGEAQMLVQDLYAAAFKKLCVLGTKRSKCSGDQINWFIQKTVEEGSFPPPQISFAFLPQERNGLFHYIQFCGFYNHLYPFSNWVDSLASCVAGQRLPARDMHSLKS